MTRAKRELILSFILVFIIGVFALTSSATAGSREQAKKIHDRIAGVPPKADILDQMAKLVSSGQAVEAANLAMQNPYFYNLNLKNWVSIWTNAEEDAAVPLNDYSATVIGMIRDDVPFNQVLFDDILYVGAASTGAPNYSNTNNAHYEFLENQQLNLAAVLEKRTLSGTTGIGESAGVMGTRAFGEAFYSDGTNRRALRFSLKTYLCRDLENFMDTTRPDFHIRRDVDRSPGGDSKVFRNKCAGCHSGMDALSGAFAYYDFRDGQTVYEGGAVQEKYSNNSDIFPDGNVTTGDTWENLWADGPNKSVGWNGSQSDRGAASLGQLLTASDAFPVCMAQKVYEKVCLRVAKSDEEKKNISTLAASFKANNYKMKNLFAETAVICMGD